MTDSVNTRELILGILMEVTKEGSYSHLVIRSVLADERVSVKIYGFRAGLRSVQ